MGVYPVETELVLAIAATVAFALGCMTQRWLLTRRERHVFELLDEQIRRLEQQRDAAHRVALDLAARNAKLRERQKSESMFLRLNADPGHGYARKDKVVDGYDVHVSEMNQASWPHLKIAQ